MTKIFITTIILSVTVFLHSCYYDNMEELYPQPPECDTSNVSFSGTIWPVISENCSGCHSGSTPSGNILLTTYDDISSVAKSGLILQAIRHESGVTPMPKNGGKLPDCTIRQFEIWVESGTPDN